MKKPIHYGVIGLGPVGTVLSTCLRSTGHQVSVLCADRHRFKCVMEHTQIISGKLQAEAKITNACQDIRDLVAAKPDVLMIATKCYDSPELFKDLKRAGLDENTVLVSCQNGLDVENQIVDIFGAERALRMVLNLGCSLLSEKEVKVNFCLPHVLSIRPPVDLAITNTIAEDLSRSGFITQTREDYRLDVFKKVILNAALGSVCALTTMTMEAVMREPELSRMVRQLVREGIAVTQAVGLPLKSEFLDEAMAYLSRGGDHKPSILLDIEQGRRTENEYLCGKLFEYGQQCGIEVAVTQTIYYLVKNRELTALRLKREGLIQ